MSDEQRVTIERRGHLLLMGLNRPAKRNAFDLAMFAQLGLAYAELERDDGLRCGVLFAHGDHFTGGFDLAQVGPAVQQGQSLLPAGALDPWDLTGPRRTKPIVSAAQGYVFTLGIEILLATDVRIAASNARFAQIEVQRGINPFGGATIRFVREAGWGNAMRWMLTGDPFGAEEALRMGIVQEVVPPGASSSGRASWPSGSRPRRRWPCAPRSPPPAWPSPTARRRRRGGSRPMSGACSTRRTPRKASARSSSAARGISSGASEPTGPARRDTPGDQPDEPSGDEDEHSARRAGWPSHDRDDRPAGGAQRDRPAHGRGAGRGLPRLRRRRHGERGAADRRRRRLLRGRRPQGDRRRPGQPRGRGRRGPVGPPARCSASR